MNRICDNFNDPCPCKAVDLESGLFYCNFIEMYVDLCFHNKTEAANELVRQACPKVRNEVLHHDYRAELLQRQEKEFLENVEPGEVCFCTAEVDNVIFLGHPSNVYGDCKYKTIDGEIREAPSFCFRILSKGTKFAEYKTKDENKADLYELDAKKNGFRVERNMLDKIHLLRIFGSTQEEVDQFVNCLKIDALLDDY